MAKQLVPSGPLIKQGEDMFIDGETLLDRVFKQQSPATLDEAREWIKGLDLRYSFHTEHHFLIADENHTEKKYVNDGLEQKLEVKLWSLFWDGLRWRFIQQCVCGPGSLSYFTQSTRVLVVK